MYDLFTQEFNLSGLAFDGRLDWLGGAFFSDDNGSDHDYVNLAQNFMPIKWHTVLFSPSTHRWLTNRVGRCSAR